MRSARVTVCEVRGGGMRLNCPAADGRIAKTLNDPFSDAQIEPHKANRILRTEASLSGGDQTRFGAR